MTADHLEVMLTEAVVVRAERLAALMTADPLTSQEWTAEDVLNVALLRGLDALEYRYAPLEATDDR